MLTDLLGHAGLYAVTFAVCFISGIVPVVSVELFLVSASAFSSPAAAIGLICSAALAQSMAKMAIYLTGYGILKVPIRKKQITLEAIMKKFEKWKSKPLVFVFISAFSGIPPFYAVSFVSGMLKLPPALYFLVGLLGLLLRFALVVQFPQAILKIFS